MKPKKNIAFIDCYFGKLPWYFNYFIHSCRFNPSIVFYIVTDDVNYTNPSIPPNVILIYKTLTDISRLAAERLGFEVNIINGYKLCDFKPAYGFIFSDLLTEYDFWGFHCDIDIIFGNIREFITDELLENYDLISVRHDWLSGCFLLYQNCEKMNTLFYTAGTTKKYSHPKSIIALMKPIFRTKHLPAENRTTKLKRKLKALTHVVKRLEAEN